MRVLRKYIKIFIALALPVYLLLLINSISNMHVHVLSNGMVVRHSHPMTQHDHGNKSHEHSEKEISFYQGFCHNYFDNSIPLEELVVEFYVADKITEVLLVRYTHFTHHCFRLRAPPVS